MYIYWYIWVYFYVRFEVVAGLAQKTVTLPGELRSRRISCIGDNEEVGDKKGVYVTPATPQLLEPLRLQIIEWHLLIPNRVEYESRIRTQVTKRINNIDASKSRITSRRLKLGTICWFSLHMSNVFQVFIMGTGSSVIMGSGPLFNWSMMKMTRMCCWHQMIWWPLT